MELTVFLFLILKPYIVNMLDEDKITQDVTKAKQIADMVVVCPHWGTEYVYQPDSNQQYWTNLFLNLGVDVVIGAHPSCYGAC